MSDSQKRLDNEPPHVPCDLLKASFDKILALGALIVLLPIYLLIIVLIKVEGLLNPAARGPVIYHQMRISEGREFPLYKFRITKNSVLNEEPSRHRRDRFKTLEQKQYCTVVGRYLKKWYLDELPQIFNILRGEMSWVGPRPFPINDYEEDLRRGLFQKKVIRAGLSGLTQVHKGVKTMKTDVDLDSEYISACRAYSPPGRFRYDAEILLHTIHTVWAGKGL